MAYSQLFLIIFTVSNLILYLNAQFKGTPQTTNDLKAVLKHSLELKCEYTGVDDSGQFAEWYRDNEDVKKEKTGHYDVIKKN